MATDVGTQLVENAERFLYGFGKSFGVIMASEIGDKTFFIAAVGGMLRLYRRSCVLAACLRRPAPLGHCRSWRCVTRA